MRLLRTWAGIAMTGVSLWGAAKTVAAAPPDGAGAAISLTEYRGRLEEMDRVVAACQKEIGPANCKSDQVVKEVQVQIVLAGGQVVPRTVRFGWLRDLLDEAGKPEVKKTENPARKDEAAKKDEEKDGEADKDEEGSNPQDLVKKIDALTPVPTISERLQAARDRLREDWEQAGEGGKESGHATGDFKAEHQALDHILSAKEYQVAVANRTLRDRILEKLNHWFQVLLSKLSEVGAKSKWIGMVAEIGFILLLCIALVWFLIRLERQGRLWSATYVPEPGAAAVSARNWQLWLEDAHSAAARGAWRDAIHLMYWASISRLESSGLWPADRARTPREYLGLLGKENSQRRELAALTGSFERTWYAGREAGEGEFALARQLAAKLGAKSGARPEAGEGER